MTYTSLWRKINGERSVDIELLVELAKVLGTSAGALLGEQQENTTFPIDSHSKERSLKEDRGLYTYTFSDGERIAIPALIENAPLFERMVSQKLQKKIT